MAAENNIANGRWYSVRPFEVNSRDPNLHDDISALVHDLQLALHPQAHASPIWVLRANQDYPDSVFIFAGQFVPDEVDRFTLRILRWRVSNGGAEVKPRGMADGYLQGQLSAAQDAVMARALDFMTTRSAELHALDAAHEHLLELQEGMEQQLFFHLVGADNANNGIMAPHGLAPHPHGGDGDALLLAGELLGDDKEESDDEEEGEEFGEDEGGMEGLQNNGEMIDVVMEGGGGGGGEAVELLLQDMFGGEDAAPAA